ncbi:hypothetical protein PDIDSM_1808 [Penicillium digitatum]|nr:hypothetical protein PDIDSM_1808 [Penicillium digitatum]
MPPKKVTSASKKAAPAPHTSYRDMIKDAIINLKERNGSSRQAIKKYVQSNNKINVTSQSVFDSQFNKAIKAGVEKNEFTQPKGPSGPLKLAKKDAPATVKPPTKTAPKTAAKKAAPKKATTTKPKPNSGKARKTSTAAPAVVEQPKILGKTKSGRITKTTAPQPATTRAAPQKRTTTK